MRTLIRVTQYATPCTSNIFAQYDPYIHARMRALIRVISTQYATLHKLYTHAQHASPHTCYINTICDPLYEPYTYTVCEPSCMLYLHNMRRLVLPVLQLEGGKWEGRIYANR